MSNRGDPVENLQKGVLIPIARSWFVAGMLLIVSIAVVVLTRDGNWFFIVMVGSIPVLWLYERSQKSARDDEKRALDNLLGIDRE